MNTDKKLSTRTEYVWCSGVRDHTHAYLLHPLSKWLPPQQLSNSLRVLDLGCGNGWLSRWLHDLGYTVIGVDPSPSGIEHARLNHPSIRFECLNPDQSILLQLKAHPFDIVVSTEVFEHCYSPSTLALTAYAALRPGGIFICSTPCHGYVKNLILAATGKLDAHFTTLWEGGHIKFFSRRTLTKLLELAGFRYESFQGAGRFPGLWKFMLLQVQKSN